MNSVQLIGRITADVILNTTQSGKYVCNFSVAVDGYNDKTHFINCTAWGKTAEIITTYCGKGSQIGAQGHIETGSYEKDGRKIYTTEVMLSNVYLLGKKETSPKANDYDKVVEADYTVDTGEENDLKISPDDFPF